MITMINQKRIHSVLFKIIYIFNLLQIWNKDYSYNNSWNLICRNLSFSKF